MKNAIVTIAIIVLAWPSVAGNKGKKKAIQQLKADVGFLASDSLEGRRMGTEGERIAAAYIGGRFANIGLKPFFENSYTQTFSVKQGKQMSSNALCAINDKELSAEQYAVLPFSAGVELNQIVLNKVQETTVPVFIAASKVGKKSLSNPHDDALSDYQQSAAQAFGKGATAVIFYNDLDESFDYEFDGKAVADTMFNGACLFINASEYSHLKAAFKDDMLSINANTVREDYMRNGLNVAAKLDNGAAKTIVLGAHYDHLGYGEDHNSLHTGKPAIHNGADDNASGVAAILALAVRAKKFSKQYNYVFIAFSGEELGLYGSKRFLEQNSEIIPGINCMINIDMLGRFDAAKNTITIGGVGTSPFWIPTIESSKKTFTVKYDSSGVGPSDHTSFYLKDKPVLFFFTGLHSDYHKPSDDANKINYEGEAMLVDYIAGLVNKVATQAPLTFTKTKEQKMEGVKFKVTLGIMPDYTFSGSGVRADGISEGKLASKVGMQTGDIIVAIGENRVLNMEGYMKALSKFKKGEKTTVSFMRGDQLMEKDIVFE
jgi:aminopeptidase YwaD